MILMMRLRSDYNDVLDIVPVYTRCVQCPGGPFCEFSCSAVFVIEAEDDGGIYDEDRAGEGLRIVEITRVRS